MQFNTSYNHSNHIQDSKQQYKEIKKQVYELLDKNKNIPQTSEKQKLEIEVNDKIVEVRNKLKNLYENETNDKFRAKINILLDKINEIDNPGIITQTLSKISNVFSYLFNTASETLNDLSLVFENSRKLGVTDKLLAFIHGDSFITATGLEGGIVKENVEFLLNYFEGKELFADHEEEISLLKNIVFPPGHEFLDVKSTLSNTTVMKLILSEARNLKIEDLTLLADIILHPSERDFNSIVSNPRLLSFYVNVMQQLTKEYSIDLSKRIQELKVNQKILIQGGWSAIPSGHAMLYMVEKTQDGKFAFTVINTGLGINNFHQSQDLGLKLKYKPIVRISEIEANIITNPELWASIGELHNSIKPNGKRFEHSANDIYGRILPSLQGKRDEVFENSVDFITAQRSGTCSWKCLMKLIKPDKRENFRLRYESLKEYHSDLIKKSTPSDESIQLLKRCSENFARAALKLHQNSHIFDSELMSASALTKKIGLDLQAIESRLKKPPVHLNAEEKAPVQGRLDASFFQEQQLLSPETTARTLITEIPPAPSLNPFPQKLSDFQQRIIKLSSVCDSLAHEGGHRQVIQSITDFITSVESLGFEAGGALEILGKGAEPTEIEDAMEQIQQVHQQLLLSIAHLPINERITPDQIALMTILSRINVMADSV